MPWSGPLFERSVSAPDVPMGLPLVIGMSGFTDAGSATSALIDYLRDEIDSVPLALFSNDVLYDYRARRPLVTFDKDHLTGFRAPRLELALARDTLGQPFLSLTGYEPDFAWESFTDTVLELADEYQVSQVTWVHAIPMPVPHTRPIGATVSGNRTELTDAHSVWQPQTRVPATAAHLLEISFIEDGYDVAGFVLLVPHYLADAEFPAAALAALDSVSTASGLIFDADEVRERNRDFLEKVAEQIEDSDELQTMLATLEQRYDDYMAGATRATPMLHTGDLPSADELAAEFERFLARGDDEGRAF